MLGWDAAGVVEAVGPDVTLFKPGDAVYYAGSITRQGANSEFHLVDERIVGAKPKSLDFTAPPRCRSRRSPRGKRCSSARHLPARRGRGQVGADHRRGRRRRLDRHPARQAVASSQVIATASRPNRRNGPRSSARTTVVNHFEDIPQQLKDIGLRKSTTC